METLLVISHISRDDKHNQSKNRASTFSRNRNNTIKYKHNTLFNLMHLRKIERSYEKYQYAAKINNAT